MEAVLTLVEGFETSLFALVMAVPRFAGVFFMTPFLKTPVFNRITQNGLYLSFCLIVMPLVRADMPPFEMGAIYFIAIMIKEFVIGLTISFVLATILWSFQAAGFFIDNQRGAAIASTMDPLFRQQTSPTGQFFTHLLVVFFFVSGVFTLFLHEIYFSYKYWPVWSFFPKFHEQHMDFYVAQFDNLMHLTLLLSGPVILIMLLSEIGLALISRFAPQLQVFFLSMPIKSAVGVFILILYLPFFVQYMGKELEVLNYVFDLVMPHLE